MDNDLFYPEKVFDDSFTFGKWVPLLCADIAHLRPFKELYKRLPDTKYTIPRSNGPFFYRNHPINYIAITGTCQNALEIPIEGSKSDVILIIYREYDSYELLQL